MLNALRVGAVPDRILAAGGFVGVQGGDQTAGAIEDRDRRVIDAVGHVIRDGRATVFEHRQIAFHFDRLTEEANRAEALRRLLQGDQIVDLVGLRNLLLELAELHQLVGEFRRVRRRQRILMLQLGRKHEQKIVEIFRQRLGRRAGLAR